MRLAVLIYGRLTKSKEHYENIRDALGSENEVDFFMSSDNSPEEQLHNFLETYKPKAFINEPLEHEVDFNKYRPIRPEHTPQSIYYMGCHFLNKLRVITLLEKFIEIHNVNYDVVVSLRLDLVFKNKFDFTSIQERHIYIPIGYDYVDNAVNDNVAYGTLDVMRNYNRIYIYAHFLLERNLVLNHPETLNYANLLLHSFHIVRVDLQYSFDK